MQSQHLNIQMGQLLDQTSNSKIKVENGHVIVQNLETGSVKQYLLPPLKFKDQKTIFGTPFKFVAKTNNIQLNPTGTILICKSLTFQQVDMSKTFTKQIALWSLYLPQRCSSFSVGIKSAELKKSYAFDFSISKPTVLTFKLDLEKKVFTCWLNGVRSEWHKEILIENDSQWTPFVRVKNIGTQLILNTIVGDPESPYVSYVNSQSSNITSEFKQPEISDWQEMICKNEEKYTLQKLTNNKILLVGQNHIKLIQRPEGSSQFDFSCCHFTKDDRIAVPFSQKQLQAITKFSIKSNSSLIRLKLSKTEENSYFIIGTALQLRKEFCGILAFLNNKKQIAYECSKESGKYKNQIISIQQIDDVAEIFLSKADILNPYLNASEKINSHFSQFSIHFNNIRPLPFFEQVKTQFTIPKSIAINNYPFIKFNSQILSVKNATQYFVACLLKDGNRISILNSSSIPFKLIDTIISRGFIKETQINQYKKQIEDINDSDFTKPHIFKILKNCLKYADKIKPPEKLLKQLQKKKSQIEVKKAIVKEEKPSTLSIEADKALLSQLISMGFNGKLSQKVLIECKNQSIEAALQLILTKYPHENEQTPFKGEIKHKPKRQWQCGMCTLINSKESLSCSACDNPAPEESAFDEIQILQKKVQQEEVIPEEENDKEITSVSIENQSVKDFFIWNTKVPYCPLLIAGVFESKIRFRLLGPNPKFYSNFYVKDNGYFDLTTLKYHEFAHQLDQSQINEMFYLTSSAEEQRKLNWGWMNIEDWDYNIDNKKEITLIQFESIKLTNKIHKFSININSEKSTKSLNCQIILDNVYEQRKRCLVMKDANFSQSQKKQQAIEPKVLQRKASFVDENKLIISAKSNVICEFVKQVQVGGQKSSASLALGEQHKSTSLTLAPAKSDLIPLLAISGPYSSTLGYPSCSLQALSTSAFNSVNQHKNGLVFKHTHNKQFVPKSIKFEVQGNSTLKGEVYVTNDLSKEVLVKHPFSFGAEQIKTHFTLPSHEHGSYLVVMLRPSEDEKRTILSGISVYGDVLQTLKGSQNFIDITSEVINSLKVIFSNEEFNTESWRDLINVNCELINYPYDLSSIENGKRAQLLSKLIQKSNIPLNVRLNIAAKSSEHSQLILSSISIENFVLLKSYTQFTSKQVQSLTSQQYLNCLKSFWSTGDRKSFEIICKNIKLSKDYIQSLDSQQYIRRLITLEYKGNEFNMEKQFINIFADELKNNASLKVQENFITAFNQKTLTSAGAELLFELIKATKCSNFNMLQSLLNQHLKEIADKKPYSSIQSSRYPSQNYHKQSSMFSPVLHKLSKPHSPSAVEQQNAPTYHFICEKHPQGRKYTIDMMSLYKVEEIQLRFTEGLKDREKLIVEVSYVKDNGEEVVLERRFFDEYIWAQLVQSSGKWSKKSLSSLFLTYGDQSFNCRYLIINLTFTTIPTHTVKQFSSSSSFSIEMLPLVHGCYLGEAQPQQTLQQQFSLTTSISLQMVNRVENFTKYSDKNDQKLFYYSSCEDSIAHLDVNNETLQALRSREQSPQNKQAIVKLLLRQPSHENLNYHFTMGYLIVNTLIDLVDQEDIGEIKFTEQSTVQLLIEHLVNHERGILMEKSVRLLRKLISANTILLKQVFVSKIASETVFNHIFKDLKLNQNQQAFNSIIGLINAGDLKQNKNLALNLSWFAKLYALDMGAVEHLVKTQFEADCLEQTAIVFAKYGWTSSTADILNTLIKQNKKDKLHMIISSSKSNKQLSDFAFSQLKSSNQQVFSLTMLELAQKSRHTKITQIQNIIYYILESIETSEEEDCEKRELFLSVLELVNKFGFTNQIAEKVVKIFFKLDEKNAYLNELLACAFMKQKPIVENLIIVALTQLNTKSLKQADLILLNDILAFVLSKEVNLESQAISFTLESDTESAVLKFFSKYLENVLNIGGLQSAKMTDELTTQKIKIAFYLGALLQSTSVFVSMDDELFEKLIRWMLINITVKDEPHPKTPNCNRFLKIEQIVWRIIEQKGKFSYKAFANIYVSSHRKLKKQISALLNDTTRYECLRKLYVFNIKVLEKFEDEKEFLQVLNLQNGLFEDLLAEFSQLQVKGMPFSTQSHGEEQIVNELTLHPDPKLKPADWLIYKNGQKNHVYKLQYFKNTRQVLELTFVSDEQFTLSKIIFAFKLESASEKNICLPKSISFEGGNSLDKLRFLGEMFEVKDDRYYNLSTKLYGFNMNGLKQKTPIQKQLNKNLPITHLRFKIRAPEPISIQDVLEGAEIMAQDSKVSLVNFLSIQGYKAKYAQPSVRELVKLLQLLSQAEHRLLINKLFNVESIVRKFKECLINFSQLMKQEEFNKVIHNFLMRICQQNTVIGNEMLEKYLNVQNADICAKIATQIVLANDKEVKERVVLMYRFIEKVINDKKTVDINILPFMNRFSQVAYNVTTRRNYTSQETLPTIPLTISQKTFQKLLHSLNENDQSSESVSKFISTILTLGKPFQVSGLNINQVLSKIASYQNQRFKELLSTLVVNSDECRKWFMSNEMLEKMFDETFSLIENPKDINDIVTNMTFLTSLSLNPSIKQLINKYQYNLKFFQLLMGKNTQSILSNPKNQELRKSFVDFIARTSLGSENQTIIGKLLKESIPHIISEGNQKFVGEIFLPLLNSFQKVPICVFPFVQSENKLITDFSNIDFKVNNKSQEKSQQSQKDASGFRLPSELVSQAAKKKIFDELIKNSYQNGKFNLAFNHGNFFEGLGETVRNDVLSSNRPFMIIIKIKATKDHTRTRTVCLFYNRNKDIPKSLKMNWVKGSFLMFIDHADNSTNKNEDIITYCKQPIKKESLIDYKHNQFNPDPDLLDEDIDQYQAMDFEYDGKSFGQLEYKGISNSAFYFYNLNPFGDANGDLQSWIPESVEYWLLYSSLSSENQKQIKVQQKSTLPQLTKSLLQTNYDHSLFSSAHKASTSLNTLRYETVYEFPVSLTVRQLKQSMKIINCSINEKKLKDLKLTIKGAQKQSTITDDMTLEEIKKLFRTKDTIILDLNVKVDNLLEVLNLKSPYKRQEVDFLPRKGILKYFEENEGIQAMIKVIKKSIEGWKNKAKMEKWLQYVTELESFSQFPHFFAIYLKDKQTFNLLFNLLAGLPDKETDPKWDALEASSSQKLLKIVSQILHMDKTSQFREYALKNNFFVTILERLRILTGLFKRKYDKDFKEEEEQHQSPNKVEAQDDGTKKIKKKKGVGYGNDSSSNTKWMKGQNLEERKKEFETVKTILGIIENFLDVQSSWLIPDILLQNIYESALLPFIEDGLRAGTLLQISKHPQKFKAIFNIIRVLSKHEQLIPVLLPIGKNYQPKQIESIESLLKSLENISSIFLSCLTQNKTTQTAEEKMSAQLANLIKETYKSVEQAIEQYKEIHMNDDTQEKQLQEILELPLDKKYRMLLKDLRFDYIDMKETPNKIKHHYSSSFNPNYTPNQNKMIRLAQELADISTALPHEHTNAIYVRCDKDRVDFMQALIMGSNGTPYGHGAYLFDVYFDDNYPNNPPKVNLTTTGHGKIRFNPNLYACGKVCLSLLGTWRGSASENWDAKVSTLLQVLLSIQAIIMSEQIYFNEPGFQNQQGTQEGEKKNQAYSNIVRYGNIKFAMTENIRNPPKGFENVIRRHFYLKKDEIMEECRKWQKYAQKRPANYVGLVNDHNHSWANEFKKSKTQYKQMLDQAIKELEEQLNKLSPPKITDIVTTKQTKKQNKKKLITNKMEELQKQQLQQIDVSYDKSLMSTESKQIDITDEKVKDRWSRYIGAMGIDAVSKQSKADILVYGLNPLGLEVVKNVVLSGCRKLTICDDKVVSMEDLAGGFFYTMEDVGKKRVESILYKIRQLNAYVKIDTIPSFEHLTPSILKTYSLVFATQLPLNEQLKVSGLCREQKIKFISADCIGFTGRIINDLGEKFEVLDKNGEQPVEVFIKEITNGQKGVVTLLDGVKNPFEDGEAVVIRNVEGMKIKEGQTEKSINETIHKVKVINSKSFEIGNTLNYTPYIRNGTVKNIKTPVEITYKPFAQIVLNHKETLIDENLAFYDFAKLQNSKLVKICYLALEDFKKKNQMKHPQPWNMKDMKTFVDIFKNISGGALDDKTLKFVEKFAATSRGYLPPLCAFFGGLVCQQIIKAITQKFKPINSEFYIQFSEIVPELPQQANEKSLKEIFTFNKNSRDIGMQMVVGNELLEVIRNSKLFMIGSGAIGCELLKNFAMIGFGTGEKGKITLTDPDHIENSNLNRQFLFREKHISKSKSRTASEAVKLMNPGLKNHITALTERVSDSTKDIFTNKFFQGLTLVANALDNVAARRYVDQRCVQNKIPLFQSGTLGPKGHVQVIIPYLTESYGSQNDPVEEGEIPHCTLKMFPEETLHCVEWARDIFGKKFSLQPKALIKIIDKSYKPEKDDIKSLNECVAMVKKGPKTFDDCINYAIHKFYKYYRDDVMQLLYTYPLDAKTKNGEPFWKLPKRPPTPITQFDPQNILQCTFVTSLAVMIAKIYQIDFPKNFRSESERLFIGKQASKVKINQFVPSDEKAKEILKESSEKKEENAEQQKMEEVIQEKDENELYKEIISTGGHEFKIKAEEFEKDDDSNGHIDFIYAMANLRAINYKLDQMDWITVKIKAGRIVPALATTTACVSGLQTLQICKYLKKIKIDLMKNSYLNLAVPSIQMSQPGEVQKKKITDKLTVNLWDRWEVVCEKSSTFGDLYSQLLKKYEIFPIGVLQGMSRIDTGKSQQAKKHFMKEKILDKLDLQDNYIDIIVLFTKSQEDDKIIEGVPPVRLIFY